MIKKILLVCLAMMTVMFSSGCSYLNSLRQQQPMVASEYESLGIPTLENYPSDFMSRYPYDMYLYDGKIYIGAGDYDKNTGPVTVWAYDIAEKTWVDTGSVPDEAVMRFVEIGGQLVIPGTDPRGSWDFGNYYVLSDGVWETVRNIPNGIHNFDMVEFDGAIFCGIGTNPGLFPIVRSTDGGKTFTQVKMYKNGSLLNSQDAEFNRVYILYVIDDALFGMYLTKTGIELYSYDGTSFHFVKSLYDEIAAVKDLGMHPIHAWEIYKNRLWLASGHLGFSENGEDFQGIYFPNGDKREIVYDIIVYGDTLYVLCGIESENGYTISVMESLSDETNKFKKTLFFEYEIPAVRFTFDGNAFYFGMANNLSPHDKTGEILRVVKENQP